VTAAAYRWVLHSAHDVDADAPTSMSSSVDEAAERIGGRYEVRVLEPSPPAVAISPWYADDPAVVGKRRTALPVVTPTTAGDVTWDELAAVNAELAPWCADRWLGAWRRLPQPPSTLVGTRAHFQRVAEHVLSAARHRAVGRIGLRWTRGGFGTPYLPDQRQLRLEAAGMVVDDGVETLHPFTTIRELAAAAATPPGAPGEVYAPSTPLDLDAALRVDRAAADFLGEWFGFGTSVLEQMRAEASDAERDSARVQLWPEHFDLATEIGSEHDGTRLTLGASPGDADNRGPYFYVLPWRGVDTNPFWDARSFQGAQLDLRDLADVDDQRSAVLGFFRRGRTTVGAGR
jgi:hypothetical protein